MLTIIPTCKPETANKCATPDNLNEAYWSLNNCALSPNSEEYAISIFSLDSTPSKLSFIFSFINSLRVLSTSPKVMF